MSLLLIGLRDEVTAELIPLLVSQGDEVRIVESDETRAERWRSLGAHVARGLPDDDDLVERAAQNVRTLVVGDGATAAALDGARRAGVGRVVHLGTSFGANDLAHAAEGFVILKATGRRRISLGRTGLNPLDVARLIDAADDLAGVIALELDADSPETRTSLGLDAESKS